MQRRKEDKCVVVRLWNWATPYVQMGGWLVIAVPVLLGTGQLLNDARAFDSRLTAAEKTIGEIAVINQKLDLLIYLMKKK